MCCAQRRFWRDLFQRIWLTVVCAIRFRMFDLCVISVLDLMSCRSHDSCQGRVFSHFLCSGANPNTNGTDRFGFHLFWSGLRRGVALSGFVSCFRIFLHQMFSLQVQESLFRISISFANGTSKKVRKVKECCSRCTSRSCVLSLLFLWVFYDSNT